jgi:membrane protease YdiL (CAAX protease family)
MFAPALACLVVRLVRREGFGDAGLRLAGRGVDRVWRLYITAYVLPIILFAVSGGIALLFGVQQWYLPAYLRSVGLNQFFLGLISAFTVGVLVTMVATFGEECGWRGYLLPRLAPLGEVWAALLVGLVWGLWHAPLIILDKYEYGTGSWLGVPVFMLVTTAFSIVFAWLRFRSGSIWPTVLAHAVINTAGPVMLVVFVTPGNLYLGAPIGFIGIVSFAVMAIWLIATGRLGTGLVDAT